ncbi:hypothetical protein SteCoe_30856 [Stentor coeruleus]|uniref:Uncharacterized protein n=1 Tax=Stentor coeruleus TaxID=5963 RepID=A0A1R2B2X3_9CILI|nr:hypothetical protein SteCoe_30856 [Stentor coeruleus]
MAHDDTLLDSTRFSDTLRYSEAKQSRKKTEEDFHTLSNRIAYLKQEEQRILKTIHQTRRKTIEITSIQSRNFYSYKQKVEIKHRNSLQLEAKAQEINKIKTLHKAKVENLTRERRNKSMIDAKIIKDNSVEIDEIIKTQQLEEKLKKLDSKQKVIAFKKHKIEKKKLDTIRRNAVVKAELQRKIREEMSQKEEIDMRISKMENEELDVIGRLQETELFHRSICENPNYHDVETIIS